VRDPEVDAFVLGALEGEWRFSRFRLGGDGFVLGRESHAIQPDVDPAAGFRAWAESRFALFQNDLGVLLRLDAAGVGERESEAVTPLTIPGYVTFGLTARLELGDALVTIRARNLEDRRRIQPWVDLATGREALSPGRTIETSLTWTLFN
jgi:outer membrane receptor protein involved in Fe transport